MRPRPAVQQQLTRACEASRTAALLPLEPVSLLTAHHTHLPGMLPAPCSPQQAALLRQDSFL